MTQNTLKFALGVISISLDDEDSEALRLLISFDAIQNRQAAFLGWRDQGLEVQIPPELTSLDVYTDLLLDKDNEEAVEEGHSPPAPPEPG